MTIVPMKRLMLCGMAREKEEVLAELQALGCLHLVPLRKAAPLDPPDPAWRRRAEAAYRHLAHAPRWRRPWSSRRQIDLSAVIDATLANKERLRIARDRRDFLVERIEGLEPFGDFQLPPEGALRGRKLWFYRLPIREKRALERIELPWQVIGREGTELGVAVIAKEEPPADLLPVPRTHTGSKPLSTLTEELHGIEIEIEQAEDALAELSRNRLALGMQLARAQDADELRAAATLTRDEAPVFALMAWAPAPAQGQIEALAERRQLALQLDDPGPEDEPPTLLANPGRLDGVGAITTFYMTPGYRSWDPSLIVFTSFAIFFAMILADAGYAALFGVILGLFWQRLGRSADGIRFRRLTGLVVAAGVVYGILCGSYFGVAPPAGTLLGDLAIIDLEDFGAMMQLSIVIGVLHLSIAHINGIVLGWGTGQAVVKGGWLLTTLAGLAIWLAPSGLAYAGVVVGLLMVFVGSGLDRPVTTPKDWLMRLLDGALGLTGVTKLFGDVLSYMRLFALGLASASLAGTFNQLAGQLAGGLPGVGVLLAILLLLFGHGVNIALGLMGGVVHGLRLNFIEFFGWGLGEEGRPFRAFARRERPS